MKIERNYWVLVNKRWKLCDRPFVTYGRR